MKATFSSATVAVALLLTLKSASVSAQLASINTVSLTRADALKLAVERSPRSALTRADASAAAAAARLARQFENPTLTASYSKSDPQTHFALDIPVDLPKVRAARIGAAESGLAATALRARYGRAQLELDVDTAYTRAQAASARSVLSARTARAADSLVTLAQLRRDAGDASDLDVELARVFAGQSTNAAINDSLSAISTRVTLQALIGLAIDSARVTLSEAITLDDSAGPITTASRATNPSAIGSSAATGSLPVSVALREAEGANYRVLVEQRRRVSAPSLSVGFEAIGPTSTGLLPTVGIALPLPLFNRNAASIQAAQAELDRARVNVVIAQLEQTTALNSARRDVTAAEGRVTRSRQLVTSANRIAALSLVAYREGASPLAAVLEAQRSARETLAQYVDDVAATRISESVLRFFSLSSGSPE